MKNRIIACIKDTKTDSHGPLTIHDSERDLIMSIQQYAKQEPESLPVKHPNDFVVKIVGEYDQDQGSINSFNEPKILGTMLDLISPRERITAVNNMVEVERLEKKRRRMALSKVK